MHITLHRFLPFMRWWCNIPGHNIDRWLRPTCDIFERYHSSKRNEKTRKNQELKTSVCVWTFHPLPELFVDPETQTGHISAVLHQNLNKKTEPRNQNHIPGTALRSIRSTRSLLGKIVAAVSNTNNETSMSNYITTGGTLMRYTRCSCVCGWGVIDLAVLNELPSPAKACMWRHENRWLQLYLPLLYRAYHTMQCVVCRVQEGATRHVCIHVAGVIVPYKLILPRAMVGP